MTLIYPKLEDYWAQYWPFSTVIFSCVMSRDFFSLILKFLHINDKKAQKQNSQQGYMIHYLRYVPLLHHCMISNFQASYKPGRELS